MESKNMFKSYDAPTVEVIEVQVERGFAESTGNGGYWENENGGEI